MSRKAKRLPPLHILEELFEYDPVLGGLFKKGEEHIEMNACGSWTKEGYKSIHIPNYGQYLLHRIVFYMFHRKDPIAYIIDHINCDRGDNRIHNLRRCRAKANSRNTRSKGKYVVDKNGVGRWISGIVPSKSRRKS